MEAIVKEATNSRHFILHRKLQALKVTMVIKRQQARKIVTMENILMLLRISRINTCDLIYLFVKYNNCLNIKFINLLSLIIV